MLYNQNNMLQLGTLIPVLGWYSMVLVCLQGYSTKQHINLLNNSFLITLSFNKRMGQAFINIFIWEQ